MLVLRGFLQVPLVYQKNVLIKPSKGLHRSFSGWFCEKFQLHELAKIVKQSIGSDFAQLHNRVQEDQQTNNVIQIKALANVDTAI